MDELRFLPPWQAADGLRLDAFGQERIYRFLVSASALEALAGRRLSPRSLLAAFRRHRLRLYEAAEGATDAPEPPDLIELTDRDLRPVVSATRQQAQCLARAWAGLD